MPRIYSGTVDLPFIEQAIATGVEYFFQNITRLVEDYVWSFWPQDTGAYAEAIINSIHRIGNSLYIDGSSIPYAMAVEMMASVDWTNPLTKEQPVAALRQFIKEMVQKLLGQAILQQGLMVNYQ